MRASISKVYRPSNSGKPATPYYRFAVLRQKAVRLTVTEEEARDFHRLLTGFFGPNASFWQWLKHRFSRN